MTPVWPGATIGILGGGQLARMLALEARRMGYRVAVLDPDPAGPAAQVADIAIPASLDDEAAARELAAISAVVTLDTEHVPVEVLSAIEPLTRLSPGARVLRLVQDRLEQRRFLAAHGLPQPAHAGVHDAASLHAAARQVGLPGVLKSRRSGYDGRGQARAASAAGLDAAWADVGRVPAVLEALVDFAREISVVLARDGAGAIRSYPVVENTHRRHVLHTSRMPADVPQAVQREAEAIAARIAGALDHVGVLAVELFVTHDRRLLVNEIAPRTHNSGHVTFGACATSQFEQHVRAICGLPLGDPALLRPAAMLNLLGDLWAGGEPDWRPVLSHPAARLHLYGKARPFAGRKMGHVLVLDGDPARALSAAEGLDAALADRAAAGEEVA